MGANNKLQATYHGGERTPDTEEVEDSYTMDQVQISLRKSTVVAREEFRRWLETVRAEAKAEALEEAAHALDSATINIEVLNGVPDLKQAWAFRGIERKSIIRSLRICADRYKENQS